LIHFWCLGTKPDDIVVNNNFNATTKYWQCKMPFSNEDDALIKNILVKKYDSWRIS